jgi:hypothetical protein
MRQIAEAMMRAVGLSTARIMLERPWPVPSAPLTVMRSSAHPTGRGSCYRPGDDLYVPDDLAIATTSLETPASRRRSLGIRAPVQAVDWTT